MSSSSCPSSSDSEADDFLVAKKSKVKKQLDLDDATSTSNNNNNNGDNGNEGFQINARFAKQYETRKRAEELTKHRRHDDLGDDDSDASTSESEDEEGDLLTPQLDVQILKTLQALKRGDERVYDKNVAFFDKKGGKGGEGGEDGDDDGDGDVDVKHKPKRYKDVVREQILEQMKEEEDGEQNKKTGPTNKDDEGHNLAYDQEQKDIRQAFIANDSDEDEDDEWTKPKAKASNATSNLEEDDEARKLWEEELQKSNNGNEKQKNEQSLADPKGEVQDGDAFLMEFMTHRKWMDNDDSNNGKRLGSKIMEEDDDDDDSLNDLERGDAFESKYNFRFEEANENNNDNNDNSNSGASHSIVHYARSGGNINTSSSKADTTLRRKDQSRRDKRLARKERKAEERKAKEEKLKRLKNARREELEGRLTRVRNVLGYDNGGDTGKSSANDNVMQEGGMDEGAISHPGSAGLDPAQEEMILKLMEGDYDPDKFEAVMNSAYGDDYYNKEDEVWKTDGDVKKDLLEGEENVVNEEMYADQEKDGEDAGVNAHDGDYDQDYGNEDYDEAYDNEEGAGEEGEQEPISEMDKKLQSKMTEELYKLDYEDLIGDMPTRFKYRTVAKNNYGLSTEEILYARDSTLKQFVSLKKMAPYRTEDGEEEYAPGTKRRKRFRQMLKTEKKEMEEEEKERVAMNDKLNNDAYGEGENEEDGTKKKKRRRQKKGASNKTQASEDVTTEDAGNDEEKAEGEAVEEAESGDPEKKRRRRKKKKGTPSEEQADATKEATPVPGEPSGEENDHEADTKPALEDSESKKKKKAKKDEKKKKKQYNGDQGGKKKRHKKSSGVEGVSGARLAAYGM